MPLTWLMISNESSYMLRHSCFISISNLKPRMSASYSTLLFVHSKYILKDIDIGTPWGVTNTTPTPSPYS